MSTKVERKPTPAFRQTELGVIPTQREAGKHINSDVSFWNNQEHIQQKASRKSKSIMKASRMGGSVA